MVELNARLIPCSFKDKEGRDVYRTVVEHINKVDAAAITSATALKSRLETPLVEIVNKTINASMFEYLAKGFRVETEYFSLFISCKGRFLGPDDRFDPKRHSLIVCIAPKAKAKKMLKNIKIVNVLSPVQASITIVQGEGIEEANTINLKLFKCGLDTVKDDYTAIVVANGSAEKTELCKRASEMESHLDQNVICQVLDQKFLEIFSELAQGNRVTDAGIGYSLGILGSYLHEDDEIDMNNLTVIATIYDEAFTEALLNCEVKTTYDEAAVPFLFERVQNGTEFGKLTAGAKGKAMGRKLSTGLEGEKIEIFDAEGTTHVITDATAGREGLSLEFLVPEAVAIGAAKLRVYSRGQLTPENAPSMQEHNCAIIDSGKPPTFRLKSLVSTATGLENHWKMFGDDTIIKVVNEGEDFTATWVLTENNGSVTEMPFDSTNYLVKLGPGEYKLHTQHNNTRMPDGSWQSGKIECVMSSGGVTIKQEVTLE